jgi:hypothetical protein
MRTIELSVEEIYILLGLYDEIIENDFFSITPDEHMIFSKLEEWAERIPK